MYKQGEKCSKKATEKNYEMQHQILALFFLPPMLTYRTYTNSDEKDGCEFLSKHIKCGVILMENARGVKGKRRPWIWFPFCYSPVSLEQFKTCLCFHAVSLG